MVKTLETRNTGELTQPRRTYKAPLGVLAERAVHMERKVNTTTGQSELVPAGLRPRLKLTSDFMVAPPETQRRVADEARAGLLAVIAQDDKWRAERRKALVAEGRAGGHSHVSDGVSGNSGGLNGFAHLRKELPPDVLDVVSPIQDTPDLYAAA